MKAGLFTVLALLGFAANSLLCRAALGGSEPLMDAASFTGVRLASGALALGVLLRSRGGRYRGGSARSALALFAYAACFSLAYVRIPSGLGALLLFGFVQATMVGAGLVRGERPRPLEWGGLLLALGGLVGLTTPGASAPPLPGAVLMAGAGVAWGVYSLRGRGSQDPLAATAGNFLISLPLALGMLGVSVAVVGGVRVTAQGFGLAVTSGALASGVGYSLWYAALPHLTATRAAIVQLSVPVLAAVGGTLLLGERVSARLVGAGAAVLCGVLLALVARGRKAAAPQRERG